MNRPRGTFAGADGTRLGCGRTIDDVWDRIGEPPDRHEATCPDCEAARANLADLAAATQVMAASDAADPTLHATPGVIANILRVARAEVRRGTILPLFSARTGAPDGQLGVSAQTVASVVRRTCDLMLGVQARRCHVVLDLPEAGAEPGLDQPSQVQVRLTMSVAPRLDIPALAQDVRRRVAAAVLREVGLRTTRIDVSVEDLDSAY